MIVRRQVQFPADTIELRHLRRFERLVRVLEYRTRVHHASVQPQGVEIVAQIVMRSNVSPAAAARIPVEPVEHLLQGPRQASRAGVHIQQYVPVLDEDPDERGELIARPATVNVGLARPYSTAESDVTVELRVVNRQVNRKRQINSYLAESLVATVLADYDLPAAQ